MRKFKQFLNSFFKRRSPVKSRTYKEQHGDYNGNEFQFKGHNEMGYSYYKRLD